MGLTRTASSLRQHRDGADRRARAPDRHPAPSAGSGPERGYPLRVRSGLSLTRRARCASCRARAAVKRPSSRTGAACSRLGYSRPQDEVDAGEQELEVTGSQVTDAIGQERAVDAEPAARRWPRSPLAVRTRGNEDHVARCRSQAQVAGQHHHDGRGGTAGVEAVALNDGDRPAKPGPELIGAFRDAQQTSPWLITIRCARASVGRLR